MVARWYSRWERNRPDGENNYCLLITFYQHDLCKYTHFRNIKEKESIDFKCYALLFFSI